MPILYEPLTTAAPVSDVGAETYAAFPYLTRMGDGRLLTAYSVSAHHFRQDEGTLVLRTSADDGVTWQLREALDDTRPGYSIEPGGVAAGPGGRLALLCFHRGVDVPSQSHVRISTDNAATWGPEITIDWGPDVRWAHPSDLLWDDDGTPDGALYAAAYTGSPRLGYYMRPRVAVSRDAGHTWHDLGVPSPPADWTVINAVEPTLVIDPGGHLLLLWREDSPRWRLMATRGTGTGRETPWVALGYGSSGLPRTVRTDDGTLLLFYRADNDGNLGTWAYASSTDNGRTWEPHGDFTRTGYLMTYAGATRLPDGRVAVVYGIETGALYASSQLRSVTFGPRFYPDPVDPHRPPAEVTELVRSGYALWATRWDDPRPIERIPHEGGLSFSLPLSNHGECRFSATVEPGSSPWRAAIGLPVSGVLVTRDDVPVWAGRVRTENEDGGRRFSFTAREWGDFFTTCPALPGAWRQNDHDLIRAQITHAQSVPGQGVSIALGSTRGNNTSDLTVNEWDNDNVEAVIRRIADAAGGPEWYFGVAGTRQLPIRQLVLGDHLGPRLPVDTLHYVEDYLEAAPRRGGNVLDVNRAKDLARAATVAVAIGDGVDAARLITEGAAHNLLAAGWPRMTSWRTYSSVRDGATLWRHAQADLRAAAGIPTGYEVTTLDGDPDWTRVPRGSMMRLILDTDRYGGNRPLVIETRVLNMTVTVPDTGDATVQWDFAEVMEVPT